MPLIMLNNFLINIRFWSPALGALICLAFSLGFMGIFGFFIEPIATDFSISRGLVTSAPVLLILVPALIGPIIGRLADSFSARSLMAFGIGFSTLSLFAISASHSVVTLALWFTLFVVGMSFCGPIVINAFLIKWYADRSGRALAISAMGASLATVTLPNWVAYLMQDSTWRESLAQMSLSIFAIVIVIILLAIPKSVVTIRDNNLGQEQAAPEVESASNFLKQPVFWIVGLGIAIVFNAALVMSICYPPHLMGLGLTMQQAASVVAISGVGGVFGKVLVATLIDQYRVHIRFFSAAIVAVSASGVSVLVSNDQYYLLLLAGLLIGFGGGAMLPMHPILNSCYFDSAVIGRVIGGQMPLFLPFGLIGAPLAGLGYDYFGNYHAVFYTIIALTLVVALLFLLLPKPSELGD